MSKEKKKRLEFRDSLGWKVDNSVFYTVTIINYPNLENSILFLWKYREVIFNFKIAISELITCKHTVN